MEREKVFDDGNTSSPHFIALREHIFELLAAIKGDRKIGESLVTFGQGELEGQKADFVEAMIAVFPEPKLDPEDFIELVTRLNSTTESVWELHTNTAESAQLVGVYLKVMSPEKLIKA